MMSPNEPLDVSRLRDLSGRRPHLYLYSQKMGPVVAFMRIPGGESSGRTIGVMVEGGNHWRWIHDEDACIRWETEE